MNVAKSTMQSTDSFCEDGEGRLTTVEASRTSSVSYESTFSKATLLSCFFTLANTIIGSGMLGLPYAYSASGWVIGTLLLMICGMSSAFSLHTLSLCAKKVGAPASFYSVAVQAMPSLTLVIDAAVAIKCFGVATSYLIVIADLMPDVMEQLGASGAAQDRHLWVFVGFTIVAPLACLRNIDSLKFTSTMSICFVIFLVWLVVLYSANIPGLDPCAAVDDGDTCTGNTTAAKVDVHTFQVLSIFVFGFTCQQNIFGVTNEMAQPTQERVNKVIGMAVGLAFCVYMLVAGCGYHTYGDAVEPDILVNYPETYLTSVARLFVSLLVAFTYPLQCHPSRRSILSLLHHWDNYRHGMTDNDLPPAGKDLDVTKSPMQGGVQLSEVSEAAVKVDTHGPPPVTGGYQLSEDGQRLRFILVTAFFLGFSLLIALTVTNLGVVLALVGATGSTTVSYILPGFFYYILFKDEGPKWKRNLALLQGCVGLVLVPLCLTFIFL
jgi:amino acid permease